MKNFKRFITLIVLFMTHASFNYLLLVVMCFVSFPCLFPYSEPPYKIFNIKKEQNSCLFLKLGEKRPYTRLSNDLALYIRIVTLFC